MNIVGISREFHLGRNWVGDGESSRLQEEVQVPIAIDGDGFSGDKLELPEPICRLDVCERRELQAHACPQSEAD